MNNLGLGCLVLCCIYVYRVVSIDISNAFSVVSSLGGLVEDIKNVKKGLDKNKYTPARFEGGPVENPLALGSGGLQQTLNRIADCDPNDKGVCCLMPNYCVPVATCSATKVSQLLDVLKAVPICTCPAGFIGDGRSVGTGCQNVDECASGEALCEQICQDMVPLYSCGCESGYALASNGYSCEDIDECALGTSKCSQICKNTPGSFFCKCRQGYSLEKDGISCVDIDECQLMAEMVLAHSEPDDSTQRHEMSAQALAALDSLTICEYPRLCINRGGGYSCDCPLGYRPDNNNLAQCIDVDECLEGLLDPYSQTSQLVPSSKKESLSEGLVCKSSVETSSEVLSQTCVNTKGSYQCVCSPGFVSLPQKSILAPTLYQEDLYDDPAIDQQTFRFLNDVAQAFGLECEDIDECSLEVNPCTGSLASDSSESAITPICLNTLGSFECKCPDGYKHSEELKQCVDIDECADNSLNLCDEVMGEECLNTAGSYSCRCGSGYRTVKGPPSGLSDRGLVELSCVDVDECAEGTDECVAGCINMPGSYSCSCPFGYSPDEVNPLHCKDIDECSFNLCPPNTPCINLPGSFVCGCPQGQQSRTAVTTNIRALLPKDIQRWLLYIDNKSSQVTLASAPSNFERLVSEIDWDSPELSLKKAKLETTLSSVSDCQEIKTCSELILHVPDVCPVSSNCLDHFGAGFSCSCPSGYQLSMQKMETKAPAMSPRAAQDQRTNEGGLLNILGGSIMNILGRNLQAFNAHSIKEDPSLIEKYYSDRQLQELTISTSDVNRLRPVLASYVTNKQYRLGFNLGLIKNSGAVKAEVPLWIITHLNWEWYQQHQNDLKNAQCLDVNECISGDGSLCDRSRPCCLNTPGSYKCQSYKGLLGRVCGIGAIDLS